MTRYSNITATAKVPGPYSITFAKGKRSLLRLINTSFESTIIFSIDNHWLEVIGADFVPITPYKTKSVLVGIGQRYHVIVTAKPDGTSSPTAADGNYWIRLQNANCFGFSGGIDGYNRTGILRYNASSQADPSTAWWSVPQACSDEPYTKLRPVLPWTVGGPANGPKGGLGEDFTVQASRIPTIFPLAIFSMGGDDFNPLRIDYGNPTFLNLDYTGKWPPLWVVTAENYTSTDWVSCRPQEGGRGGKS